jgi:drug/metabolite transporter (DMT)-like permease
MCFINYISQNTQTVGFQLGDSNVLTIVLQVQIIETFLIDLFWFGIKFTSGQLIGAIIVAAFTMTAMIASLIKSRSQNMEASELAEERESLILEF